MDVAQIQNLMTLAAFGLLALAVIGGAAVLAGEMRLRAQRRGRDAIPLSRTCRSASGSATQDRRAQDAEAPGVQGGSIAAGLPKSRALSSAMRRSGDSMSLWGPLLIFVVCTPTFRNSSSQLA